MRLYLLLIILGVGLVALLLNHGGSSILGLQSDDFGRLVYLATFAILIGSGVMLGRRHWGQTARNLLIWIVIILALSAGYIFRNDASGAFGRFVSGLVPGRATVVTTADGKQEVVLHKAIGGHFSAEVTIDGQRVPMLIDTGASIIALSYEDASRLGLKPDTLTFSMSVMTANGRATAAPVRLPEVSIGPIRRTNVAAMVAARGALEQSLLGMSFLGTLSSIQMQTDEMHLRD